MYSQNNEEKIILDYFGDYFIGTFLSLGENDGVTLSNTYALAKRGWFGVCVEASPKAFERLVKAHPFNKDIEYLNVAAANYNGEIVLHESGEHLDKGDVSLLSTTVPTELERWPGEVFREVRVKCMTFDEILKNVKRNVFHFISIDIEGSEISVLRQMDLNVLGCKMLCVEFNGKFQYAFDSIVLKQGYKLIHRNGENLIYVQDKKHGDV